MHKPFTKDKKGFTIIEVLIVLAIAGLILLIVFLAVPALQRNSRNTGRKSDVARVGGSVTEWMSNNNGKIPAAAADATAIATGAGQLGQYDFTGAGATDISVLNGAQAAINNTKQMRIVTNAQCGTNGATVLGSSSRQIVIQYTVEAAGVTSPRGTPVCSPV